MNAALSHILYVEDDPDIRTVARIALETVGGFQLHVCASGAEALQAVASGLVPELIMLDVMMPDMDGPSTLASLRKLPGSAAVPVLFMTAKVQSDEIAHYRSLGAIDVIAKPFDPMLLAQQVRDAWGRHMTGRSTSDNDLHDKLRALDALFLRNLPQRLVELDTAFGQCLIDGNDNSRWAEVHRLLHSLAGSAGMFGFQQLGLEARRLEGRIIVLGTEGAARAQQVNELAHDMHRFLAWARANPKDNCMTDTG